jgi:hypothetical protein
MAGPKILSDGSFPSRYRHKDHFQKRWWDCKDSRGQGVRDSSNRFSYIAYGSICELETQILLSGDLGYIETGKLEITQEGIGEVERMLKGLIKSLERKALDPLNP